MGLDWHDIWRSRLAGAAGGELSGFGGAELGGSHAFDFAQGRLLHRARG
jgi:hypothetical protein